MLHSGCITVKDLQQHCSIRISVGWMPQVSGYVKAVSSAGVFVVLARNAEARVKMGHLSDSFVKDPKEAFPEGKLVEGRVLSAADGRCSSWTSFSLLPELLARGFVFECMN